MPGIIRRMLPIATPAEAGFDPQRLERAFALAESWTRGPNPPWPAAAIAIGRNGKLVAPRLFGRQGAEPDAPPVRRDGLFLMASLTKPITYLAALMLVERGLLNLADLVTRHIPDFAAHHKENTTVLHLFTHTSGLPDMPDNNLELRRQHAPLDKFVERTIRDTVPLFPPGTNFSYQSMGTLIVAELVRRLTGLTIHEFVRREVFEPLGLQSTSFGIGNLDPGRIVRMRPAATQDPSWGWNSDYWRKLGVPWGGMYSCPEDMAVLCQLMLNGGVYNGVRLLAATTVAQATSNRLDDLPDVPEPVRRTKSWGLGWQMNRPGSGGELGSLCDVLGTTAFGHHGATGTLQWIDPVSRSFCVIFSTAPRDDAPWRLLALSNALAAS